MYKGTLGFTTLNISGKQWPDITGYNNFAVA